MGDSESWTFPEGLLKKIPPLHYMHILDNVSNVVRVEVGPLTLLCKDQEQAVYGPNKMVIVPPGHYVVIANPVLKRTGKDGKETVVFDPFGQALLKHGDKEIRLHQDPFPLYPGESIEGNITPIPVVEPNTAMKLQAQRDFTDKFASDENGNNIQRRAGEEWLFYGPACYTPQPEVRVVQTVNCVFIKPGQALRLRTSRNFKDRHGISRKAGEEWHVTTVGAYLPAVEEEVVKIDDPIILTEKKALCLTTNYRYVDVFGKERFPGESWLVTSDMAESHIPHVLAQVVSEPKLISLNKRQWAVILDPVDPTTRRPQYGLRKLLKGEQHFFLQPGEKLQNDEIKDVYVLTANYALPVQATEAYIDTSTINGQRISRVPGEMWLVRGPKEYWPDLQVKLLKEPIKAILPLGPYSVYRPEDILFAGGCFFAFLILRLILRLI